MFLIISFLFEIKMFLLKISSFKVEFNIELNKGNKFRISDSSYFIFLYEINWGYLNDLDHNNKNVEMYL
jgi:hypothetical protein